MTSFLLFSLVLNVVIRMKIEDTVLLNVLHYKVLFLIQDQKKIPCGERLILLFDEIRSLILLCKTFKSFYFYHHIKLKEAG